MGAEKSPEKKRKSGRNPGVCRVGTIIIQNWSTQKRDDGKHEKLEKKIY